MRHFTWDRSEIVRNFWNATPRRRPSDGQRSAEVFQPLSGNHFVFALHGGDHSQTPSFFYKESKNKTASVKMAKEPHPDHFVNKSL